MAKRNLTAAELAEKIEAERREAAVRAQRAIERMNNDRRAKIKQSITPAAMAEAVRKFMMPQTIASFGIACQEYDTAIGYAAVEGSNGDAYARIQSARDRVHLDVRWSFSVDVDVYVRFESSFADRFVDPDDAGVAYVPHYLKCEVNWPSTSRSINEAAACVQLYAAAIALAQRVEAVFGRTVVLERVNVKI